MKLWIDVLTPKQALFAKAIVERAPSRFKCTITSRKYSELDGFLNQINLNHVALGRHGGKDLSDKLKASLERQVELFNFAREYDFDRSFSFISPEAARVSFGLGVEHYICSDSPHAWAPCRLAVPLAAKLFYPFPIMAERWSQYGLKKSLLFPYHALDPWAWISNMHMRNRNDRMPQVIIRLEESFASYFKTGKGVSDIISSVIKVIPKDFEIVIIPRYDDQRTWASAKFGRICTVPTGPVNGPDIISTSSLVIGGGGTMTQEAALLGVPNISYFPSSKLDVFENFYFPLKLSARTSTPSALVRKTREMLENILKEKQGFELRASKQVRTFEDPVKFIFDRMEE